MRIASIEGSRVTVAFDPPEDSSRPPPMSWRAASCQDRRSRACRLPGRPGDSRSMRRRARSTSGCTRSRARAEPGVERGADLRQRPHAAECADQPALEGGRHDGEPGVDQHPVRRNADSQADQRRRAAPLSVVLPVTESITIRGAPGDLRIFVRSENDQGGATSPESVRFTVPGGASRRNPSLRLLATRTGSRLDPSWGLPPQGPAPTGFLVGLRGAFTDRSRWPDELSVGSSVPARTC